MAKRTVHRIAGAPTVIDVGDAKPVPEKRIVAREHRAIVKNRKLRETLVPVLTANEGEEKVVVEKEIQKTSLHAVREMKEQLLYSDDPKDRREAAQYFLNAAGHGKKEGQLGGAGSIIVITGLQAGQMPWQTVEGKVVNANAKPEAPQVEAGSVPGGSGQGRAD